MIEALRSEINSFFVGKEEVVDNVLICMLAGGHVLLEDVPGVGKTTLAETVARATECRMGRIQFTPDTLPGDITGISVYNTKTGGFEYREGVIMNQLLLADEINRTSPKTQASLLEAMAEGHVTVDGHIYELPKPFMVIATQNPVEFIGTYPLPEAQKDRFMMRLSIGYPSVESELKMARNYIDGKTVEMTKKVCSASDILQMMEEVKKITVNDAMLGYMRDIINRTREEKKFVTGASPRALLFLVRASQARAYLKERDFVKPDDVKAVTVNVLHHRLELTSEAEIAGDNIDSLIANIVIRANVPLE